MSLKNSLAQKKRWAKISKRKRTEIMRPLAILKNKKMTVAERSEHGRMMVDVKRGIIVPKRKLEDLEEPIRKGRSYKDYLKTSGYKHI